MLGFGDRKAGRDVVAWMASNAADIGIVQIEIAESRAVSEGCKIRRCLLRGADNGGSATAVSERDVTANSHRLFVEGGESAADRIDEMHLDAFYRRFVEVLIAKG